LIKNLNEHEKCIKNSNHIVKIVNKAPKYFFSKSKGHLGHTDLVQHKINTGSAVPIRQSLRRLSYGGRQTEKEEILRMLDLGDD
jgi:hypothetical protein